MAFVRNTWYAVGWADEISRKPLSRTILGEPIVFYRTEAGQPVALADLCPHRLVPLSLGFLDGDAIECRYHGLAFDRTGACVSNPHGDGVIPKAARVATYPLHEAYNLVWIWMGDEVADPAAIAPYPWLADPSRYAVSRGSLKIDANYLLVMDNLTDLSHAGFLHVDTLEPREVAKADYEVSEIDGVLWMKQFMPNMDVPPPFKAMGREGNFDHWLAVRCLPPGCMITYFGITEPGRPREEGWVTYNPNIITPETESSTHYFWAVARDFLLDAPGLTEMISETAGHAFEQEDKPLIEAQQKVLGEKDLMKMKPVLLRNDSGSGRARRAVERMLKSEEKFVTKTDNVPINQPACSPVD
jgi:vanillate O-demethylase monooxygenase subunit